jgi:hypothetical protein
MPSSNTGIIYSVIHMLDSPHAVAITFLDLTTIHADKHTKSCWTVIHKNLVEQNPMKNEIKQIVDC